MTGTGMAELLDGGRELLIKAVSPALLSKAVLAVCGLIALQLLWAGGRLVLDSGVDPVPPVASALSPAEASFPEPVSDEQDELVSRPLYWEGRRPAAVPEAAVEPESADGEIAANDPIHKVKLLGIIAGGESPGVIVKNGKQIQRVARGEQISGWTLSLMSPEGVVVEKGEDSYTLMLEHVYPQGTGEVAGNARAPARDTKPQQEKQRQRKNKAKNS